MMGIGNRFLQENYFELKPFIRVRGKTIIENVVECFLKNNIKIHIACNDYSASVLKKLFLPTQINILQLQYSSGAAHTILQAVDKLEENLENPLLCVDCDVILKEEALLKIPANVGGIGTFIDKARSGIYSYLLVDKNNIIDIVEKNAVSEIANAGVYLFSSTQKAKEYCSKSLGEDENYLSNAVRIALREGEKFIPFDLTGQFTCVGTPRQLTDSCIANTVNKVFCFDIDKTLIYDIMKNPAPITSNIDFCNNLYDSGAKIILHSSRGMLSTNGNIAYIENHLRPIIKNVLKDANVKYHELILGKPYADFYIDDKAICSYFDLEKATGFYFNNLKARYYHKIAVKNNEVIKHGNLLAESFYYKNIPVALKQYFPRIIVSSEKEIKLEFIDGKTYCDMYLRGSLNEKHIIQLLDTLKIFHSFNATDEITNWGYNEKVLERYSSNESFYNELGIDNAYINKNSDLITVIEGSIIHGDPVFTNIFENLKFVDPRGSWDNKLTIYGDKHYDYAKVLQSLQGYEYALFNENIPHNYTHKLRKVFLEWYKNNYPNHTQKQLFAKTNLLIISMLPLHREDINRCQRFKNLLFDI